MMQANHQRRRRLKGRCGVRFAARAQARRVAGAFFFDAGRLHERARINFTRTDAPESLNEGGALKKGKADAADLFIPKRPP